MLSKTTVRFTQFSTSLLTALMVGHLGVAIAQTPSYPAKNINLILPFSAGGGTDTATRIISQRLTMALGKGFVIENKPGANGMLAASSVARAAPDGYTLLVTTNTTHSAAPGLLKNINYDPIHDFTPIARTGNLPLMLLISPDVPANSVSELIAYAKANPGKLTYASGSSSTIVSGATFTRRTGIDALHVPYKSTPPALNDLIGGRISMMFADIMTALPHVKNNSLRALAVTTKKRSALLPDLPSMEEAGVKDFDITSWQAWFGPANLPEDVITKLNTEISKIVDEPEVKTQLAELGMEAFSSTPEELTTFVNEQLVVWTRLIKEAGIEPQ